jgi:hypothetical protein
MTLITELPGGSASSVAIAMSRFIPLTLRGCLVSGFAGGIIVGAPMLLV